jgi:hypothetical protein
MSAIYPNSFLYVDSHINGDPYQTAETAARATWYGASSGPTVVFDGLAPMAVGAQPTVPAQQAWYISEWYSPRWTETGGLAPVSIQGSWSSGGTQMTVNATVRLEDPVTLTGIRATIFVAENHVLYGASTYFDHITRKIYHQNITLTNVGDEVAVNANITLGAGWNPTNLEVYAIVQKTSGTKEIYQAAKITPQYLFDMAFDAPIRSVPAGNGDALFTGHIRNLGALDDTFTLSVDAGFGWPTAFRIGDDPTWYTDPQAMPLAAGSSAAVTVRVTTDGVKRIGLGNFACQSAATGSTATIPLQVYNTSYSVFFVDDDLMRTDETAFTTPFATMGFLYQDWDVYNDHGNLPPTAADLKGFDLVIWQFGYANTTMNAARQAACMTYLDDGGRLYLSGMDVTTNTYPPAVFAVDYLGIASRTINTMAHTAVGVPGDPISADMSIPLTFLTESLNKVDTVNPTATAHSIFFSETGNSAALANELVGGGRVVFNTIVQNAFDAAGAWPNNNQAVLERSVAWLMGQGPSSAPELPALLASHLTVVPNPFAGSTDLRFNLSPRASAGAVRLTVVDVAGRQVRTLVDGRLSAGTQLQRWNGADDLGRALPSGIYFSRLQTDEGVRTQKVILTR